MSKAAQEKLRTLIAGLALAVTAAGMVAAMLSAYYCTDAEAATHRAEFVEHVGEYRAHAARGEAEHRSVVESLGRIEKTLGEMDARQREIQRDLDKRRR